MALFSLDDVRTLGSKLDGLSLTPGELAVLDAMVGGPPGPEVEGFGQRPDGRPRYRDRMADSFSLGFKVEIEGFTAPDVAG